MRDVAGDAESWLVCPLRHAAPDTRLICFPSAGAGASLFRSWGQHLPPQIEVWGVQLPGRESRLKEVAYADLPQLLAALRRAIVPWLGGDFAFFGHSMGALVAYELARELVPDGRAPRHLIVAGHRAPHFPMPRPWLHLLSERELTHQLRGLAGTPPEVLDHPELRRLLLPALRADLRLCAEHHHRPGPPLPCPIAAFGGVEDPEVSDDQLEAWREHTMGEFSVRWFPGGHFFVKESTAALLAAVEQTLVASRRGAVRT